MPPLLLDVFMVCVGTITVNFCFYFFMEHDYQIHIVVINVAVPCNHPFEAFKYMSKYWKDHDYKKCHSTNVRRFLPLYSYNNVNL